MRASRTGRTAALLGALAALGCSATPLDADAGAADGGCEWEHYFVYDYTLDGVPSTTGCQPGHLYGGYLPEWYISTFEVDLSLLPEPLENRTNVPEGFCGFAPIVMHNIPVMTSGSGPVLLGVNATWAIRPETDSAVRVPLLYDGASEGPCRDGAEWARITGGTWHVLRGTSDPAEPLGVPGDWIELEVRDLTVEPIDGHEIRFDRLYFRVQVQERREPEP